MNILLIGGMGSIGQRYQCVLSFLGHKFHVYDNADPESTKVNLKNFDRWIIASPTDTHYEWCMKAIENKATFLCEKPLSKDLKECIDIRTAADKERAKGFVVNNYYMIMKRFDNDKSINIKYDFYHSGKDGLEWDCCQLIYRDPIAIIDNRSPVWSLSINWQEIQYREVELSYIKMIDAFLRDNHHWLWDLQQGVAMTKAVLERIGQ